MEKFSKRLSTVCICIEFGFEMFVCPCRSDPVVLSAHSTFSWLDYCSHHVRNAADRSMTTDQHTKIDFQLR